MRLSCTSSLASHLQLSLVFTQKDLCPDFATHNGKHVLVPTDLPSWPQMSQEQTVQKTF